MYMWFQVCYGSRVMEICQTHVPGPMYDDRSTRSVMRLVCVYFFHGPTTCLFVCLFLLLFVFKEHIGTMHRPTFSKTIHCYVTGTRGN